MKRIALAVLCLAFVPAAFAKDPKPAAKGKAAKIELKALKPTIDAAWEGNFNAPTETWTFEKYTPGPDDINEPNRFYIDHFPSDRPKDVEAYAKKLQSDKNFQDMGSLFIKVSAKEKLTEGWLITGTQKDMSDKDDKGMPAFVLYRDDLGLYCRGSVFRSEALRGEAIEACKTLKP